MKTKQATVTHINSSDDPKIKFVEKTTKAIMLGLFVADTGEERKRAITSAVWDAVTAFEEANGFAVTRKSARGPYARR